MPLCPCFPSPPSPCSPPTGSKRNQYRSDYGEASGLSDSHPGSADPPPPALAMLASMGYGPQGSQGGGAGGGPEDSYGSHSGATGGPAMSGGSTQQRGGSKRVCSTSRLQQQSLAPGVHR